MPTFTPDMLNPRELAEMEYAKEQSDLNRRHEIEVAKLELELRKRETSWNLVFKIPLALIFLPVKICLAFAALVGFAFGRDFPDALWDLLKS